MYRILTINPGSTSTKIAVFYNDEAVLDTIIKHNQDVLNKFNTINDQYTYRKEAILEYLKEKNVDISKMDAIVGRGGSLKPLKSGTYQITDKMLEDLRRGVMGEHASSLGGILANDLAKEWNIPSYIVDPPTVDEMDSIAKISGLNGIERKSKFHALNQKAVARFAAKEIGKSYNDCNLIVAHLGGGISVGAHSKGRVIDVNNALDGEGTFTPERSGSIPAYDIIKMCYSGKYSMDEMMKKITRIGGMTSYLQTNDCKVVSQMVKNGNKNVETIYKAMAYQVAKEIGSYAAVLKGKVDAIVLTGGIAFDKIFVEWVTDRVSFISDIIIYPGEYEMLALAQGGLRVLKGQEEAKLYL